MKSINHYIPGGSSSVHYRDLDFAINTCLELSNRNGGKVPIFLSKTDLMSAFCLAPIKPSQRFLLIMKAYHPVTNQLFYFIEKNLPFGASLSCKIFQSFSDSLRHLVEEITGKFHQTTNYLDDFLFVEISRQQCNRLVLEFIKICEKIRCPLAMEKTEWATTKLVFLGILLDGENFLMCIPEDKKQKAITFIKWTIDRKKLTVKQLQSLTGMLNFLSKAIIPGRTFTRCMYAKLEHCTDYLHLKHYHHISLDAEFVSDCRMWLLFLTMLDSIVMCRPFVDIQEISMNSETLDFYTDASANQMTGGFGGFLAGSWFSSTWPTGFVANDRPSIAYLELFALVIGILIWSEKLRNRRITIFCDNTSVCNMVNALSSRCKNCMILIRLLALQCMVYNIRISVLYIPTYQNTLADALSREDIKRFWDNAPNYTVCHAETLHEYLWPMDKIWKHSHQTCESCFPSQDDQ